jgi:hypothetical protein
MITTYCLSELTVPDSSAPKVQEEKIPLGQKAPEAAGLAHHIDLLEFDIPEFETPDMGELWRTLGRGHSENGVVDRVALTTRLRALGAGALALAAVLEATNAPVLTGRAEELVNLAADSLLVHDARRAATLREELLLALGAESRIREVQATITRIKNALVEPGIATAADFSKDSKATFERAIGALADLEAKKDTGAAALPPKWRDYVEPAARLRLLLRESPSRLARDLVGRELELSATTLRELERALAAARKAGWSPGKGARLVVDPMPTGRPRGRRGQADPGT